MTVAASSVVVGEGPGGVIMRRRAAQHGPPQPFGDTATFTVPSRRVAIVT